MVGRGGHASVVADALGDAVDGWILPDTTPLGDAEFSESEVLKMDERPRLINGLGYVGGANHRRDVFERFSAAGFGFETIVHRTASLASDVRLAPGSQVLLGSMLNVGTRVGKNSIVNSASVIEHHVVLGNHCHVAPNATVCGDAVIGDGCFVGAGAVVIQGVELAPGTTVGAGAVVTKSYDRGAVLVGIPARPVVQ